MAVLAACIMRLLAAWLTQGAPENQNKSRSDIMGTKALGKIRLTQKSID